MSVPKKSMGDQWIDELIGDLVSQRAAKQCCVTQLEDAGRGHLEYADALRNVICVLDRMIEAAK